MYFGRIVYLVKVKTCVHRGKLVGTIVQFKRGIAVSLFLLFLIHNLGFFLVLHSIRKAHRSEFSAKVSQKDFDARQLKTAAIPISFPYQHDEKEFKEVNETMELNGTLYHIVKKRYENNMLHIVYLDDETSKKVKEQFDDWRSAAQNDGTPAPNSNEQPNVWRTLDYQYLLPEFSFLTLQESLSKNLNFNYSALNCPSVFIGVCTPPPKHIS